MKVKSIAMLLSLRGWWCWIVHRLWTHTVLAFCWAEFTDLKKIFPPLQWKSRQRNNGWKVLLIWMPVGIFQYADLLLLWVHWGLDISFSGVWSGKSHVVHRFDAFESRLLEEGVKVTCPVVRRNNHSSILCTNKLGVVHISWLLNNSDNVIQTAHPRMSKHSLQQAETPIRSKLGMPHNQKWHCDVVVEAHHHPPRKILHHVAIFVLTRTVICVEGDVRFP